MRINDIVKSKESEAKLREVLIEDALRNQADALAEKVGATFKRPKPRKSAAQFPFEAMLERHLAELEIHYRGLLEAAPDALVVVNGRGEIILLNLEAERQFGYGRDELIGQPATTIVPKGLSERLPGGGGAKLAEEVLVQLPGAGIELTGVRKDGSRFPIEVMMGPMQSADGVLVTVAIRNISVRRAAQKQIELMEARYRGLVEAAPDAMVVLNKRAKIIHVNALAQTLFGYTSEELIGRKITGIIPDGLANRLTSDDMAPAALGTQNGSGFELIGRHKQGGIVPLEVTLGTMQSPAGVLITMAMRDVRQRKAAQQRLAQMEAVLEFAPDAIVVVKQGGEIVFSNLEAEHKFGYDRAELVGQSVSQIVPEGMVERLLPDSLHSAEAALARQIDTGIELSARRKDGRSFPVELKLSPFESAGERLVTVAVRDITVRKAAERQLGQSESGKYRTLLEAAPDAMIVTDAENRIVLVNAEAERLYGWIRAELIGQPISKLVPRRSRDAGSKGRSATPTDLRGTPRGGCIEALGLRRDNTEFPMEFTGRAVDTVDGVIYLSVIRDVSARNEARDAERHQEGLERQARELSRSNEDLQQFAYVAAHDLQEPLRMVASYTQLLSQRYKGRLDSDADEFIDYAVDGAHRMQLLITDLLAYCRVGTTAEEFSPIESEKVLEQALLNLEGAITESGASVTHDPLPTIVGDRIQLTQLFQNVVGNAIKYRTSEAPKVHISARRSDAGEWVFAMSDNGLGIEPQYFDKIFGMFQRLHGRQEFSGTGIGLTICKKIAERHGGRMWVESEPGRGSTFYLSLPDRPPA